MPEPKHNRGRSKQDYRTPRPFLDAACLLLGVSDFIIDLAATHRNAVCSRWISAAENSLVQPWHLIDCRDYRSPDSDGVGVLYDSLGRLWGWLNPEFDNIEPWARKSYEETRSTYQRFAVAMLVPASVGSNWWRDWVHNKALVCCLNGRVKFVGQSDQYPRDLALLLYGPCIEPGYRIWTWRSELTSARVDELHQRRADLLSYTCRRLDVDKT
jgi:hypothetical protein